MQSAALAIEQGYVLLTLNTNDFFDLPSLLLKLLKKGSPLS